MVQNISTPATNNYGAVSKIGTTENGRIIYQLTDPTGQVAGKISVAQKDCDTFEKSYKTIMETAPKLQEYAQNTPPEKMEKMQKRSKWIIAAPALILGFIAALKTKGNGLKGALKQIGMTMLATGAGLGIGIGVATKTCTPPGSVEFTKATRNLSKIDMQPIQ